MENGGRLFGPETEEYAAATRPHNSSGRQHPAFVGVAHTAEDVVAVLAGAARRDLKVMPQATGHGAGGEVGADTVILDTTGLDSLTIDAEARVAAAGAGLTWGSVNREAEKYGLLGLAGSAPSVSISGYTFGGGIGWLCRPHGMASAALRRVQYVTGDGQIREATDDAGQLTDREAIWAFRGGGGVGIATQLEFDLVRAPDLYAGYLLWTVDRLAPVVAAWAAAMSTVDIDVATSISVLHLPPTPPFPEQLRGQPVVHLAVAAGSDGSGARPLLESVRAAAAPSVNEWGPANAERLGQIHLDPPTATPAIGDARWLTDQAPTLAERTLAVAAPTESPLALIEIRSVGNDAGGRAGAETTVPGPYIVHAVGPLTQPDRRTLIEEKIGVVRAAAAPADVGRSVGSWMEGATRAPDALPVDVRERVAAIAQRVDPKGVIRRTRYLT